MTQPQSPRFVLQSAADTKIRRRSAPAAPPADPDVDLHPATRAARTWLIRYLRAAGGAADSRDVFLNAELAGHKAWQVRRGRRPGIRIESIKGTTHRTRWVLSDIQIPEPAPAPPSDVETRTAAAAAWLLGYLSERGGLATFSEMSRAGVSAGHRVRALQRAAVAEGIRIVPIPGSFPPRTTWSLPNYVAPDGLPPRPAVSLAEQWLVEHLEAAGGRCSSSDVKAAGVVAGFHPKMLDRARIAAGVRFENVPGSMPRRTEWALDSTLTAP